MEIKLWINKKLVVDDISPDQALLEFLREHGCYSVKRGCETSNCGLCTVWIDEKPVLSCTMLAAQANGKHVTSIEGLQEEAKEFGGFLADQGSDQCGYCSPGLIMNILAMVRELENPTEEEIKEYLSGNLCRCTGYMGQLRAIKEYLKYKEAKKNG